MNVFDQTGRTASWAEGQPIGRRAWDAGERGMACRSAVPDGREELAHFARPEAARPEGRGRWHFDEWFLAGHVEREVSACPVTVREVASREAA